LRSGRTLTAVPPVLPEQQQNGRNQGTGVTDPHPPYKRRNVPCPSHGFIKAPCTDPYRHGITCGVQPKTKTYKRKDKADPPGFGGFSFYRFADIVGDIVHGRIASNKWRSYN